MYNGIAVNTEYYSIFFQYESFGTILQIQVVKTSNRSTFRNKVFQKSQKPEITIDFTTQITLLKICKQSSIFILQVWTKSVEEKCNRNNVKSCKQIMNWLVYKLGRGTYFVIVFTEDTVPATLHVAGCIS